jgi:hypothetical protein
MKTRIEEAAEKWWYKPLHDTMNSDGTFDKDMFRYKDLGKQNGIQGFIAGAEFMQKEFDLVKHQLDYAEKILTEVQADKFKLKAQNDIMREALESIAKDYERPSDMMKKAREALKEIKE